MKTRFLSIAAATFAVAAAAGGAYVAAAAVSSPPTERTPGAIISDRDDEPVAGDDDGTRDQGHGDVVTDVGDRPDRVVDGSRTSTRTENRAPRAEVRDDGGRREVRTETAQAGTQTYDAAEAGSVTLLRDGEDLTITDVTPASGWRHAIERAAGYEVEVTFRRDGQRVDFKAEIEHQWVKVRVRER